MKIKMKRLAALVMTLVMCIMVLPMYNITSYAAAGKITFSDPTVTVGDQVSVRMKIDATDGSLGASDVRLEYDSSALEFVSGTGANGGAGSIRVVGAMESADQKTFSFTLKFKALKAGTSSIKVTSQEVYDADAQTVTIDHVGSSAVKINAPVTYSKDATLSGLTISPGELSPAFSSDVTEYTATVYGDTEKLTVSAPAAHEKASVVVEGNESLQIGENTVTCKVTAEDGATTKTYTILVTKSEEMPTESETETDAVQSGGSAINVEEGNWQVAETFDAAMLPEGFTVTDFTYDGLPVQAGVDAQGNILLYMTNENGEGDFFLYSTESNMLAPYVTVHMAEKTVIVLPPEQIPEGTALPENFIECTIDIGTHTVKGWIWNDKSQTTPEYCVVYGQNENGERNFYRYDQKEMTLQRYFQDPDGAAMRTKYEDLAETYTSLLNDYKMRGFIMAGLFAACIVLLIILIVLLVRKPKHDRMDQEDEFEEFVPTRRRAAAKAEEKDAWIEDRPAPTAKKPARRPAEPVQPEEDDEIEFLTDDEMDETSAAPVSMPQAKDDDDFEFIDLDL